MDPDVPITYHGVFDGHGGQSCAEFVSKHLHGALRENLMDGIEGIHEAEGISEGFTDIISKTFKEVDLKYKQMYKDESN